MSFKYDTYEYYPRCWGDVSSLRASKEKYMIFNAFYVVNVSLSSVICLKEITVLNYTQSKPPHQPHHHDQCTQPRRRFSLIPTDFEHLNSAYRTRERWLSGSPLPAPPPSSLFPPGLQPLLPVNGKLLDSLSSPAVGNNHWGACIQELVGGGGGGGERERSICCSGARGTAVSGPPAGSQSESDPHAPLFTLRAEMNENTKTIGELSMRTTSAR